MLNEVFEIIDDIQMTDNTWQEADAAKRELKERIKELFLSKSGENIMELTKYLEAELKEVNRHQESDEWCNGYASALMCVMKFVRNKPQNPMSEYIIEGDCQCQNPQIAKTENIVPAYGYKYGCQDVCKCGSQFRVRYYD
jgi:hypothetical protein